MHAQSNSLQPHGFQLTKILCPWDSPGKNTGVGCHFLLQGIFPQPRGQPESLSVASSFFTIEPPGKLRPKALWLKSLQGEQVGWASPVWSLCSSPWSLWDSSSYSPAAIHSSPDAGSRCAMNATNEGLNIKVMQSPPSFGGRGQAPIGNTETEVSPKVFLAVAC